MILPVTINNLRVGHDFVLITYNAGVNLYFGNNVNASGTQDARGNPDLTTSEMEKDAKKIAEKATGHKMTPSQISRYWTRKALQFLVSDPAKVAWLYARKIRLLANPVEMPNHLSYDYIRHEMVPFLRLFFLHLGLMVPLAAVGLWAHFRHSPSLADKLFLAFLLTYALSLLPFFITDRYRLPLVPFLIAFAAVGCVEVLRLALARSWKELFWAGGILLAAAWAINQPFPFRLTFCHTRVTMADRYVDRSDVVVKPGNPDLSLAIVEYKQSIETQPSYSMAYQRLARVYEMVGYFTGNLKLLDTIEQLDSKEKPRWEAIRANIQEQLAKKGDLVAERKIPKTPYEKALADEDAGDIAHAMEKYEDIVHRDPFHFMAYSHWGNLEMKLGEKYKAISIFEEGLVENPESPDLLNGLAEAYYQTNNQAGYNRIRRILNGPRAGRE
jgi:tetratricopeptide (TPR) repeat protein